MFHSRVMSNSTTLSNEDASTISYGTRIKDFNGSNPIDHSNPTISPQQTLKIKKKRNLPGNPGDNPDAEVIALSPKSLLATNRFVCEICNKGFQRDQNLQLHRRGHNLPWKLKQRKNKEIIKKRAYVCPEPTCVHNHPSRALGDLTGIKKHFSRKHGEKKWKCEKCEKIYAVQSDWKAHNKTCGTREYVCDCGTLFIRKDSFVTHRAFCDALAQESARLSSNHFSHTVDPSSFFPFASTQHDQQQQQQHFFSNSPPNPMTHISLTLPNSQNPNPNFISHIPVDTKNEINNSDHHFQIPIHISSSSPLIFPDTSTTKVLLSSPLQNPHVTSTTQSMSKSNPTTTSTHLSATSLLQKAATIGITTTNTAQQTQSLTHMVGFGLGELGTVVSHGNIDSVMSDTSVEFLGDLSTWHNSDRLTRDFLGLTGDSNGAVNVNVKDMLNYASGVDFNHDQFEHELCDHSLLKPQAFGFAEVTSQAWGLQG